MPDHGTSTSAAVVAGFAMAGALALMACNGSADGNGSTPQWCEPEGSLNTSCEGDHCVTAVVVDYVRLEPRGYRVIGLTGDPIELADAEGIALSYLTDVLEVDAPGGTDCDQQDRFIHCVMVYDTSDQYLVVIHQPTGQVVLAELETWADPDNRGYDFPLPAGFSGAEPLGCVDPIDTPEVNKFVTTGFPLSGDIASTAGDALTLTRGLNLAEQMVADQPYRAFVISHAPAMGEFDAESADWYVWLYR